MNFNHCLYLVSDQHYPKSIILMAIKSGIDVFQYRAKNRTFKQMYEEGLEYKQACRKAGVIFIVNDHLDLALALDADGIHLGQDDAPVMIARQLLPGKIIGQSVQNEQQARQAANEDVDYIGVGAIFKTNTKSDAKYVSIKTLHEIARQNQVSIVCIGGINTTNFEQVLAIGEFGLAICSDLLNDEAKMVEKITRYKNKLKGRRNGI